MAKYWTWLEIKTKVERDLDLEGEVFITENEMLGYGNEALAEVGRQLHALYEDYFITRGVITLVSGTESYALPSDIYAMKVRALVYSNGSSVWKLNRIKDWYKFETYEQEKTSSSSTSQYGYFIVNETAGAPKILLAPTPNENGAFIKIWYIRNVNELIDDTTVCDIPEAVNYIIQYIKVRCYEKDMNPNLQKAMQDLEQEKETTLAVLATMVPDNENEIEADMRLYNEMT